MKAGSRPQYYRIRRMVQMVREGAATGYMPNSSDFMKEFEVSRRTVARDLDFLRDEERAPLAYDDARHGFRLTDETFTLPPVTISRREAFSFALARKLLAHYEGTPLHMDMRSVLDKIAESLEGDNTIEPAWISEHVGVLPEDRVRIFVMALPFSVAALMVKKMTDRHEKAITVVSVEREPAGSGSAPSGDDRQPGKTEDKVIDLVKAANDLSVPVDRAITEPKPVDITKFKGEAAALTEAPEAPKPTAWEARQEILVIDRTKAVGPDYPLERKFIPVVERISNAPDMTFPVDREDIGKRVGGDSSIPKLAKGAGGVPGGTGFGGPAMPKETPDKFEDMALWPSNDIVYMGLVPAVQQEFTNGTIIVFNGNAGCALDRTYCVDALVPLGYRVILFEYPSYGARGGEMSEKAFADSARSAVKSAKAMYGDPVYLWGESLGAAVACSAVKGIENDIAGIILLTPWNNLSDLAQDRYWFFPSKWLTRDKFNSVDNLRDYKGPVAVIMSRRDEIIPNALTMKLYDSITTRK